MATARLALRLFLAGLPGGSRSDIYGLDFTSQLLERRHPVTLNAGDNGFSVPVGLTPTLFVFTPPAGNTQVIKLKGTGGDLGHPIHKTQPTILALDSTQGIVILNAAATINGCELLYL